MDRKGLYSATIALSVLIVMIAIVSNSSQDIPMEEAQDFKAAMLEVKTEWSNTRAVLDRAASQGIANEINGNGCAYGTATDNIQTYYNAILGEMFEGDCDFSNLSVTRAAGDVDVTVTISCSKGVGEKFSVSYGKSITFEKSFSMISDPPCVFNVSDRQAIVTEYSQ